MDLCRVAKPSNRKPDHHKHAPVTRQERAVTIAARVACAPASYWDGSGPQFGRRGWMRDTSRRFINAARSWVSISVSTV